LGIEYNWNATFDQKFEVKLLKSCPLFTQGLLFLITKTLIKMLKHRLGRRKMHLPGHFDDKNL
jgi:hypothetical protein